MYNFSIGLIHFYYLFIRCGILIYAPIVPSYSPTQPHLFQNYFSCKVSKAACIHYVEVCYEKKIVLFLLCHY